MKQQARTHKSQVVGWTLRLLFGGSLLISPGCSILPFGPSWEDEYEQQRRLVEGVDFRPEGASAERIEKQNDLFVRLGLRAPPRKDIDRARELFNEGEALYREASKLEGDERIATFRRAADVFLESADTWQSSSNEQNALMLAAESSFFAEDYYEAEQLYARLVEEYPRNKFLDGIDKRRFEIADYWLKSHKAAPKPFVMVNFTDPKFPWNDTGGHGKRLLEDMRMDNPTGMISDDATMRLAIEYLQKEDFEAAADTFADLRLTYPDSEHQFNARLLEMQALLASYRGKEYTSLPLTDAAKRLKEISIQFPTEASEHSDELNEAYAKIRFFQAERLWMAAERRTTLSEIDAARFNLNQIVEKYSDTPFAAEARKELESLADRPGEPRKSMASQALIWLFRADADEPEWLKQVQR